jgi:hypothetical protein
VGGFPAAAPQTTENWNLRNTDFVDLVISEVLRDFPFSRNQPLKSADDEYIRILKNKLIKLKKKQEDRTQWLSRGTCSYIVMYINAVAKSVMLYLQHDFYKIIFKIKCKLCIASVSAPPPPSKENFWVRVCKPGRKSSAAGIAHPILSPWSIVFSQAVSS